jgi:fructuronate reductase
VAPDVARFDYDREAQKIGIVHIGAGAFHRAHQAWYTDLAMSSGDRDWMIVGASLRSSAVSEQLNPQDGLYSLSESGADGCSTRIVVAIREVLVAERSPHALAISLIAPSTRLVTITVTEKGYCRAIDGSLDLELARGNSLYRHLAGALRERMLAGIDGLTILSCDNLPDNGRVLRRLMNEYFAAEAPDTLGWFEKHCSCPNSMVDRIVPATTPADLDAVERRIGLRDEAAVVTEPFSQWVIEDRFAGPRPRWEVAGAQFVDDVRPYETAKLRMLNGAHSAMAYLGLLRAHRFVHEAIADPAIRATVEQLMRDEAAPTLDPAFDAVAYADALLARFANSALPHRLSQIAMDGSQKIPQRWLAVLAWHQRRGRACPAILEALAAWLLHVRGDGAPVDDPLAGQLAALWREHGRSGVVGALFGAGGLLAAEWQATPSDRRAIEARLGAE